MSPDNVEAMTYDKVRQRLPPGHKLVVSIRSEDLDPQSESRILSLAESTDGGALVVGVTYELGATTRRPARSCPECGAREVESLGPADQHVAHDLRSQAALFRCKECGSAWDE